MCECRVQLALVRKILPKNTMKCELYKRSTHNDAEFFICTQNLLDMKQDTEA